MKSLITFFIRNSLFGDLISFFVIAVGIFSLFQIRRDAFPNINFDVIVINTIYPGASPEEIEKLITNPIEQDLKEVDGIKKLQSQSTEGRSYILAQLDPDQTTETKAKEDIKSAIDQITFPEQSEDPKVFALETKQQPIIQVSLSSEESEMKLREVAKRLEKKLERLPGVAKISYNGLQDLEIHVHADPKKLKAYRVSLDEMIQAIRAQNVSVPAGTLDPDPSTQIKAEKIVRTIGEYETPDDVGQTVIRANDLGQGVRVQDVAKVFYALEKKQTINKTNGVPSINLTVIKKEKADAITLVDLVKQEVDEFKKTENSIVFSSSFVDDISTYIRNRISVLSNNMIWGLVLVCLTLTLFLPWKVSLIVTAGVVLSFFGTIAYFHYAGYSLNLLSLLGIIIVSGMLVDDAIVVSDNVSRYMSKGLSATEAALKGALQIWPAVSASVLTIIVAFLPMMFMSGIFGKFVREIPLGVVIALFISLAETIFLVPQHFATFVKLKDFERPLEPRGLSKIRFRFQDWWDQTLIPRYSRIVKTLVLHRYKTMGATFGLLVVIAVLSALFLKFILFPAEGIEIFFIRARAPVGITLDEASQRIKSVEKVVAQLPQEELEHFVTTVGLHQQEPDDPNTRRGPEYTQIIVYLTPDNLRERTAQQIIDSLRGPISKVQGYEEIKFDRVNPGPPVGKPVSIGVQGEKYDEILIAARALQKEITAIKGVQDIENSYTPGKPEIHVIPLRSEAAAASLNANIMGQAVRAAVDGIIATSIQRLDEEVDIRVSFHDETNTPSQVISKIEVLNPQGNLIPLNRIARIEEKTGILSYEHTDNRREVKVTADVNTDIISSASANKRIRDEILPGFSKKFPQVRAVFGGEDEDTQESLKSLVQAFVIALIAIFLILVLTFGNLIQPFLILLTVPLGIIGTLVSLLLLRQPLSFMAILGIIALAGVIVNNSIIYIDFVNQARKEGASLAKSIIEAAVIRARPIFLTVMTTVVGVLPTVHGIGGQDLFVTPIAIALGYGLLFGSILTAFVFPAAIAIADDIQGWIKKKFNKTAKAAL